MAVEESYDEVAYWNERENPNNPSLDPAVHAAHIEFVRMRVGKVARLLDFGPGIGRIFPAYGGVEHVVGYDISSKYYQRAMEHSKQFPFKFSLDVVRCIQPLPYIDKSFDVAVAVSILLHQRPCHILMVMKELARVAKRVVVIAYYDPKKPFDKPSYERVSCGKRYCFNYQYGRICTEQHWFMTGTQLLGQHIMFEYCGNNQGEAK